MSNIALMVNPSFILYCFLFPLGTFQGSSFTPIVGKWDVSKVVDMDFMFAGATITGTMDLSSWSVSSVLTMEAMVSHGMEFWMVTKGMQLIQNSTDV